MEVKNSPSKGSVEQNLSQNLSNSYIPKGKMPTMPMADEIQDAMKKKEAEKTKKDIDKITQEIKKKYKFVNAIGIAPAQSYKIIEEEYEIPPADSKRELIHLLVIIPESKFKEVPKIKPELIKIINGTNNKVWAHILTPIDFWNLGLDSKFDVFEAWGMSYPLHDPKNFLGSVRMCQVHKSLVLRKFEKYVTTYGMFGSLVRGELKKESDVDVVIIIDDTDVKRMSRFELIEKLRGIIQSYVSEAMAIAGTKVDFNVQVWLLTDFWERVKDVEPVAFTFIRDGIPLYDRGAFLPWKSLLRMGRIKPSPESVDMFMSAGDKMKDAVSRRLFDILIHDLYWGTIQPTQGLLMLYGLAPQNVYDTEKSFKEIFVDKEKLIEKKYHEILKEITVKYYKGFEHGKIKPGDISGADIDRVSKNALDYVSRLKELRGQIEQRIKENDMKDIYDNLFTQLESILKVKGEENIIKEFETVFVKTGKFPNRFLKDLQFVAKIKKEASKKAPAKTSKKKSEKGASYQGWHLRKDVENARKKATQITNSLIEYSQRSDFLAMDRSRFIIKGEKITAEVFFLEDTFVIHGPKIQKVIDKKLVDINPQELEKELVAQKDKEVKIDFGALEVLKKELGDFELVY